MRTLKLFLKGKGIYLNFVMNLIANPRNTVSTWEEAWNWIENQGGGEDAIVLAFEWITAKYPKFENPFIYWSTIEVEYLRYLES